MALNINIPGYPDMIIQYLVLDLNGTIASKGEIKESTVRLINALSRHLQVFVLTADTFGKAGDICQGINAEVTIIEKGREKEAKGDFVSKLGKQGTIALGNGMNDELMLEQSVLGITVMGEEGCSTRALKKADVLVKDIDDALEMIMNPDILKATLRS